ncbi:uncharacterized protein EV422DRAFT_238822 [Fimicolochytrium jonesii]|uniref:uncharacterized protein n=1 Tax=Fimicolochytrium jonesii TaxID=1396493 RepID=UPI0022FEDC3C|nr:uncharacterized protein EV422DRAFT_238822 [Fimicolochytrium jonesii]KAI8824948.1 hypothetical protein EV422DRAFT_238822 [Fimicolochytrium jonesii]
MSIAEPPLPSLQICDERRKKLLLLERRTVWLESRVRKLAAGRVDFSNNMGPKGSGTCEQRKRRRPLSMIVLSSSTPREKDENPTMPSSEIEAAGLQPRTARLRSKSTSSLPVWTSAHSGSIINHKTDGKELAVDWSFDRSRCDSGASLTPEPPQRKLEPTSTTLLSQRLPTRVTSFRSRLPVPSRLLKVSASAKRSEEPIRRDDGNHEQPALLRSLSHSSSNSSPIIRSDAGHEFEIRLKETSPPGTKDDDLDYALSEFRDMMAMEPPTPYGSEASEETIIPVSLETDSDFLTNHDTMRSQWAYAPATARHAPNSYFPHPDPILDDTSWESTELSSDYENRPIVRYIVAPIQPDLSREAMYMTPQTSMPTIEVDMYGNRSSSFENDPDSEFSMDGGGKSATGSPTGADGLGMVTNVHVTNDESFRKTRSELHMAAIQYMLKDRKDSTLLCPPLRSNKHTQEASLEWDESSEITVVSWKSEADGDEHEQECDIVEVAEVEEDQDEEQAIDGCYEPSDYESALADFMPHTLDTISESSFEDGEGIEMPDRDGEVAFGVSFSSSEGTLNSLSGTLRWQAATRMLYPASSDLL